MPFKLHAIDLGLMHQSNGRGDKYEHSWNRAYFDFQFILSPHWALTIRPWMRLNGFLEDYAYNPKIQHYLVYGDIRISYQLDNIILSLMLRNTMASDFARGAEELDCTFPLYKHLHGFIQIFSGYGQSLISYDHYTNAVGFGVSLYNRYTPQFH